MDLLFTLITCSALVTIIIQDFRFRKISWPPLVLMLIASLFVQWPHASAAEISESLLYNLVFLVFLFLGLKAYLAIKHRRFVKVIDLHVGWGDVLFLAAAAFSFAPLNFMIFQIGGMIFCIACHFALYRKRASGHTVPLAGYLSLFLLPFYIIPSLYSLRRDDLWIIEYLV